MCYVEDLGEHTSQSLLSFIAKFFLGFICPFSPAGSLLDPLQSSFYPHHSNKTALVQSPVTSMLLNPAVNFDSSFFYVPVSVVTDTPFWSTFSNWLSEYHLSFFFGLLPHLLLFYSKTLFADFSLLPWNPSQMLFLCLELSYQIFPWLISSLHLFLCLFQITSLVRLFSSILLKIGAIFNPFFLPCFIAFQACLYPTLYYISVFRTVCLPLEYSLRGNWDFVFFTAVSAVTRIMPSTQ